jgi:uncharacterized protein (DUF849 family)
MLIKAALNGGRTRAEHPAIPITPDQLAASAKESVAAGARAIHFHVRDAAGRESLDPEDVANALTAVRSVVPGTPIGISTGAWILQNATLRLEKISHWRVLPDFASVNFNEEGALALAQLLLSLGVAVEVGISDLDGAKIFVNSGVAPHCLRLLLEPFEQSKAEALKVLEDILQLLSPASAKLPIVFHGLNLTAWDLIDEAATRGYGTRIGFEDILTLPGGQFADGNAALVSEAMRRMHKPRST